MKQLKFYLTILSLFCFIAAQAQEKTITGKVTDDTGPLPGASIIIKGTTTGTQSDFDGNYSIKASIGDILVFSFIGMSTQEIAVGTSDRINVQMQADNVLEEVVITAQGIKVKPRALSYSVEGVGADDVTKARETNMVSALSAKASGVQVTSSSGSVGASANIRIRGNTSITRSNSPLFVVDGVPIDNSSFSEDPTQTFNNSSTGGTDFSNRAVDINSNDIESINILKGIAAQTLYGLRAANGVVLITTKKGKAGKTKVTFNASTTFAEYNKLPELQQVYAQGRHNPDGSGLQYRGPETLEGDSWGPRISDLEFDGDSSYPFDRGGRLVPRGTGNGTPARAYDHSNFFVTGLTTDVNLSVSGGNDKTNYRASAGRLDQDGISPNEKFQRQTYRFDLNSKLTEKLNLETSAQFTNSGGNRVQRGSNISGIMLGLLRTTPTFDNGNGLSGQEAADDASSYFYEIAGSELPGHRSYRDGIYNNPYFTVARNANTDDVNRFIGRLGLSYDLRDWLNIKSSVALDRYTDSRKIGFDIIDAGFGTGRVINDLITNQDLNWNTILSLNKGLSEKIELSASLGFDGFYTKSNRQTVIGDGLTIPGYYNLTNAQATQPLELSTARKLIGAFATATIGFKDILYLTPSFRNDWSSTLPVGDNTFQSYSVGGSFVFSEVIKKDWLGYGKLRASWGKTGNDAPIFSTITTFGGTFLNGDLFIQSVTFPAYDAVSFERSPQAGNPFLKPEETTEFEIGAEFSFLNRRLTLDVAYYDKETTDQIIPINTPTSSGFSTRIGNAGIVTNNGVEVSLGAKPIKTDNFSWDVNVNWTTYENKVEELVEGVDNITLNGFSSTRSAVAVGESYGAIYGDRFLRNENGQVLIDDDGFPLLDPVEGVVGDPIPDWLAGISNNFKYKNLSLSALIDIRQGGDVWCGTCGILDYFGVSARTLNRDQTTVFEGVVESTGQNNTQAVAISNPNESENNNLYRRYGFGGTSEASIYDASWIRLRELTLTYDFPQKWLENSFIESFTISAFGRNLWLETDYPGLDPETNLTGNTNGIGLEYFNQPNTKSYGFNLRLNF